MGKWEQAGCVDLRVSYRIVSEASAECLAVCRRDTSSVERQVSEMASLGYRWQESRGLERPTKSMGGGCGLDMDVDAEGGWEGERSEGAFHVAKERSCRLAHGPSHA